MTSYAIIFTQNFKHNYMKKSYKSFISKVATKPENRKMIDHFLIDREFLNHLKIYHIK